jgi:hypothetical protein
MHHVTAHRQVVKKTVDVAGTRARDAVHRAPSGQVALAPDHDLGLVETETRGQRTLQDRDTNLEHLVGVGGDREALRAQLLGHTLDRRGVRSQYHAAALH